MDTWIDKVMVIRTRFMWDIGKQPLKDDLHWPELGILLESIDYHEAARKASFLGSRCEDSLMAAVHFERRFDALMKYVINSQEHPSHWKGQRFNL